MQHTKRILVVEDDIQRIHWFRENLPADAEVHYIDIATRGVEFVNRNKYDMIFLDHDLGNIKGMDNTGYTVAKALSKTGNTSTEVVIHSWNPIGARQMAECLRSNGFNKVVESRFGSFSIKNEKKVKKL
jgi:CheY-like chemotaxis protein